MAASPQEELVESVIRRHGKLESTRKNWESVWQELATYILPRKGVVTIKRSPGAKNTDRLFDSTAIHANELLAASMQGTLTSGAVRWFRLRMQDKQLNEDKDVALWLEDTADRMYLALQQSNFGSETQEVYLDLGCFGVGGVIVEERDRETGGFNGLRFTALTIGSYSISEDPEARVDTLYRNMEMPAHAVIERWGKSLGMAGLEAIGPDPDKTLEIIHGIYPRGPKYAAKLMTPAKKLPWASCYVLKTPRVLLSESGYHEFPAMVPRWTKTGGEIYGRGPGHTALPDVKTLNKSKEIGLRAWAKAIDPPLQVLDDGIVGGGPARLTPGAQNNVRSLDTIKPIEFRAKFDISELKEDGLKSNIRDIFFNSQLQLPAGQIMTATEVERRYELMQRLLGPTLGRLESEFLNPMIQRVFGIMLRASALMPAPQVLAEAAQQGGGGITIEYEGPLARSQRGTEVMAIQKAYGLISGIAQLVPTILDNYDHDEAARLIGVNSGVPVQVILSKDEVGAIRQARQAEMEEQKQQMQMAQMAESAGKVAPLVKALQPGDAGAVAGSEVPR